MTSAVKTARSAAPLRACQLGRTLEIAVLCLWFSRTNSHEECLTARTTLTAEVI